MSSYADTPRFRFQYPLSSASTNVPGDIETPLNEIDNLFTPTYSGTATSRPSPGVTPATWTNTGTTGRLYYATDTGKWTLDTGSAWIALGVINTVAGNIHSSVPGNTVVVGSTGFAADAGHVHAREAWGVTADIQPIGTTAAAGSSGRVADAAHVHPGFPAGIILAWAGGVSAPSGYLLCNGASLVRATHAALFAAIGTTWGSADGTHFNVPNLVNSVPIGAGSTYTLATAYGAATHVISATQLPKHKHTATSTDSGHGHSTNNPSHTHAAFINGNTAEELVYTTTTVQTTGLASGGTSFPNVSFSNGLNIQAATTSVSVNTGTANITTSLSTTGNSTAVSLLQPSVGVTYIIKAT